MSPFPCDSEAEKSSCGVGFVASLKGEYSHDLVQQALQALQCVEHRGACNADRLTSDGAGIMLDIPFELFGHEKGSVAIATLFAPRDVERWRLARKIFETTFDFFGAKILGYRKVPVDESVLGPKALQAKPRILHAIIKRPGHCRSDDSFNKLLYQAKQFAQAKLQERGIVREWFFTSLSATTLVYKALVRADKLAPFYLDLQNPACKSRFALFHRRFSTNTTSTWDKAQPFRLIGHNGEFNTIATNKSWAFAREKASGLKDGEVLTHEGMSDSGSFNEMVEALAYRSSLSGLPAILAIMMPPAQQNNSFYEFWGRAMEPWDGPALVVFADDEKVGGRLDRNGFRPCRWARTPDHFYLCSEAGAFAIAPEDILQKGALAAGRGVTVDLQNGEFSFGDPSQFPQNSDAKLEAKLYALPSHEPEKGQPEHLDKRFLFNFSEEDLQQILIPMIREGKEPIGSMGDTARLAIFSQEPRPIFDYFYQNFAQVTNPPLDYLRERNVTDLRTCLGARLNIFDHKQLLAPAPAFALASPVLSLAQMEFLYTLAEAPPNENRIVTKQFDITFNRDYGAAGLKARLQDISRQAVASVRHGASIIILSDRHAGYQSPPIPSLLALRAVICALNDAGLRLEAAIVVDSAEIRTTHHVAALIGFGAAALCPYLALEGARFFDDEKLRGLSATKKEKNLLHAYEQGLLKVMSKMGISVARSYQNSKLFTVVGLDDDLMKTYFDGVPAFMPGKGLDDLVDDILRHVEKSKIYEESGKLIHIHFFKEHNQNKFGEKHAMTNARSKVIHKLVRNTGLALDDLRLYEEYLQLGHSSAPVSVRHLFRIKESVAPLLLAAVQPREEILKRFGAGAMSYGALSAEAQRDIFLAMREINGRSNSGEGGENPYYAIEGLSASTKQVASARFGVTARYLISAEEIEIKIAQGAKPGEGGQLMGVKVDAGIARARHAPEGVTLISPPPLHDIYSIEDLKQLIYELHQINPSAKIAVKLVAGANIGTIAVGVAKAGADIIHIAGGDGGTGAAGLSSMKHTGLPWEFGLIEAHQALIENNLREHVILRVDGGLHTGEDIVMAAIMGAEQYNFGKLLLVAQGCVMARICEKNTCPTGITTHNPKFKAKYKGHKDHIVKLLHYLAEDVRRHLAKAGVDSLPEIIGRTDLLEVHPDHEALVNRNNLDLSFVLSRQMVARHRAENPFREGLGALNQRIMEDTQAALEENEELSLAYEIKSSDRAVLARLAGEMAQRQHQAHLAKFSQNGFAQKMAKPYNKTIKLTFTGSAGQGFGVFMSDHLEARLFGEANDSVCKSMSGGKMVICPSPRAPFEAEENVIIGNCALYGATGGKLYVRGLAGDRFAIRNSGALAIVEGAGLHACEYMTNGVVIILGETSYNLGSGMTGGTVYLYNEKAVAHVNTEFLIRVEIEEAELEQLKESLEDYFEETQSQTAGTILSDWNVHKNFFKKFIPLEALAKKETVTASLAPAYV